MKRRGLPRLVPPRWTPRPLTRPAGHNLRTQFLLDLSDRQAAEAVRRRGQTTRWTGFLAHLTETCSPEGANVITVVATTAATTSDAQALPGNPTRQHRRNKV